MLLLSAAEKDYKDQPEWLVNCTLDFDDVYLVWESPNIASLLSRPPPSPSHEPKPFKEEKKRGYSDEKVAKKSSDGRGSKTKLRTPRSPPSEHEGESEPFTVDSGGKINA